MVEIKDWKEFKDSGLLWYTNLFLHAFGWYLLVEQDDNGNIVTGAPARTDFRGFSTEINDAGYLKLTEWIKEHIDELDKDVEDLRNVEGATNSSPMEEEWKIEPEDLDFN